MTHGDRKMFCKKSGFFVPFPRPRCLHFPWDDLSRYSAPPADVGAPRQSSNARCAWWCLWRTPTKPLHSNREERDSPGPSRRLQSFSTVYPGHWRLNPSPRNALPDPTHRPWSCEQPRCLSEGRVFSTWPQAGCEGFCVENWWDETCKLCSTR